MILFFQEPFTLITVKRSSFCFCFDFGWSPFFVLLDRSLVTCDEDAFALDTGALAITVIRVNGSWKNKIIQKFFLYQFLRKIPVAISYNSHLRFAKR